MFPFRLVFILLSQCICMQTILHTQKVMKFWLFTTFILVMHEWSTKDPFWTSHLLWKWDRKQEAQKLNDCISFINRKNADLKPSNALYSLQYHHWSHSSLGLVCTILPYNFRITKFLLYNLKFKKMYCCIVSVNDDEWTGVLFLGKEWRH